MKPGDLVQVVSLPGFIKDVVWCHSLDANKTDTRIPVDTLAVVLEIPVDERSGWSFESDAKVLIDGHAYLMKLANLRLVV